MSHAILQNYYSTKPKDFPDRKISLRVELKTMSGVLRDYMHHESEQNCSNFKLV